MRYLLDTNVCIQWMNGEESLRSKAIAVGSKDLFITNSILAELFYGAFKSGRVDPNLARVETFVQGLNVFGDSQETARIFDRIKADLRKAGKPTQAQKDVDNCLATISADAEETVGVLEAAGKTGLPPQAYFSDSHLDTLGLCVFFALAAREKPEEILLVLDDVLASIDEPHVERLIEMIYSESLKFRHCLITTHYRPWKEKRRWGWLQHGQCPFVELSKWSLQQGLVLTRSIPDIERLRALLAETPLDPQLVCAKAGVILEAILDFLTLLYSTETNVSNLPGSARKIGRNLNRGYCSKT